MAPYQCRCCDAGICADHGLTGRLQCLGCIEFADCKRLQQPLPTIMLAIALAHSPASKALSSLVSGWNHRQTVQNFLDLYLVHKGRCQTALAVFGVPKGREGQRQMSVDGSQICVTAQTNCQIEGRSSR